MALGLFLRDLRRETLEARGEEISASIACGANRGDCDCLASTASHWRGWRAKADGTLALSVKPTFDSCVSGDLIFSSELLELDLRCLVARVRL